MKLVIPREEFLRPVQHVVGVVEKRQTLPILGNLLLEVAEDELRVTGTDLEVELVATVPLVGAEEGVVTVSARKLVDIIRSLPEGAMVEVGVSQGKVRLTSGRSRFVLATLPAEDFPKNEPLQGIREIRIEERLLRRLIGRTHFAMAQQDVRYFLIGLLLEAEGLNLRAVATDGHRLALCEVEMAQGLGESQEQVIVPRKGVLELVKLLDDREEEVSLKLAENRIQVEIGPVRFTSKLIDGKFPEYERVIPVGGDKTLRVGREELAEALGRASILSNEKFRGVRLQVSEEGVKAVAYNPEQESAEEEVSGDYDGEPLEIGFNVNYLLDAVNAVDGETVRMVLSNPESSCLITGESDAQCKYVVMPMRL